jgi:hypothetical protein
MYIYVYIYIYIYNSLSLYLPTYIYIYIYMQRLNDRISEVEQERDLLHVQLAAASAQVLNRALIQP